MGVVAASGWRLQDALLALLDEDDEEEEDATKAMHQDKITG